MKNSVIILALFFLSIFTYSQSFGDIRTTGSGSANWTDNIWEVYLGSWQSLAGYPSGELSTDVDISREVTLNSLTISISGTLTVSNTLRVQSSGKLYVNPTGDVVISGSLITDGTSNLLIKSNSGGTGSLRYSGSPNGIMQCFILGNNNGGGWHLIGPPTDGLYAADAFLSGYMQTWSDGNPGSWTVEDGTNPSISRGRGAAYFFFSNFTANMAGQLNGQAKTIYSLTNAGGSDDGWHLLANPFPCGIDLNSCGFTGTLGSERYVYNGSSYVQRTNLAASQGFFIRVVSSGNYSFPIAAKTAVNSNIYKSTETDYIKLLLLDKDGISKDELIVRFNENATENFNPELDGLKLIGNPDAGELMAEITAEQYAAIRSLPFPNQIRSVPIYIKKGNAAEYTISIIENELENIEVTLYDIENDIEIDLEETLDYNFVVNDSIAERFNLQFKNASAVNSIENNDQINIRQSQGFVIIEQENPEQGDLRIYDISGKLIIEDQLNERSVQRVSFNNTPMGVYIVHLIFENESFSQKIIK